MKELNLVIIGLVFFILSCNPKGNNTNDNNENDTTNTEITQKCEEKMKTLVKENLDFAQKQYSKMLETLPEANMYPKTTKEDGSLEINKSDWWTSGFFPGSLWYLYEYTNNEKWKIEAIKRTMPLEIEKDNKGTHDLGFMLYCSFGNGYRLTKDEKFKEILITGAHSLTSRFNENVGCIKSWDWKKEWKFPVIIDNMMNLEFLFWAADAAGNSKFAEISKIHANTTMKNHFREDYSSYHVVNYDPETGEALWKGTFQGASDSSAWSRGQAWALYGYALCYRFTKDKNYLEQAKNIEKFIFSHKNMPEDLVPYWDFDRPGEEYDASAGALYASALIELSNYVEKELAKDYMKKAMTIIKTLSSNKFRAKLGENNNFILKHSTGHKPGNSEVDVPLSYADYYFIEALLRLDKKLNEL